MAEIEGLIIDPQGIDPNITWSDMTESDTCDIVTWPGGNGYIEVTGSFGGATVTAQYGFLETTMTNLNVNTPDDGTKLTFTEAGFAAFELPEGYLSFSATGGTSQSVTIKIRPKRADL